MSDQQPEPKLGERIGPRLGPIGATLRALFRTRVTAGLLVVLPIYVTVLLIRFIFDLLRDSSRWLVEIYLTSSWGTALREKLGINLAAMEQQLGHRPTADEIYEMIPGWSQWAISIFCVFLTIFLLYSVGLFTANFFGRRLVFTFERIVDRLPFVKTIYRATKQILATFTGGQSQNFQRVALIKFPQDRMRCVGFITSVFRDSLTDEELATVFIPTTPNPTTGYLQIVRRAELVELNWSVEDAVRTIMSGGILRPDFLTIVAKEDQEKLPADVQAMIPEMPAEVPQPTPEEAEAALFGDPLAPDPTASPRTDGDNKPAT